MTPQSSSIIVLQVHAEGNNVRVHTMTTDGLEQSCQLRPIEAMSFISTADSFIPLGALFCFYGLNSNWPVC